MKLVVIDTNVWVSAFLNRKGFPARIKDAWVNGEFEVVLSSPLLQEISEVLHRPRIKDKYGLSEEEINQFLELLMRRAVLVTIGGQLRLCRDVRDNMFLETAIIGGVGYLISRDDDLKGDSNLTREMSVRGVKVTTVSHFLSELANEELRPK
jgi:putative PIN family toxin of toxin-antitoxin system